MTSKSMRLNSGGMTHTITLGDREFSIEYQIQPSSPATFYDPGQQEYIEIEEIYEIGPDGENVVADVSDDELNAINRELKTYHEAYAS
jgi:hypothetical protein